MANENQQPLKTTPAAYDPMKNKPNRNDPETARLLEHYAEEYVMRDGKLAKKFELCPVCGYAMSLQGDDPRNQRMACAWEPLHTPAK